jgi:hypothetical protein
LVRLSSKKNEKENKLWYVFPPLGCGSAARTVRRIFVVPFLPLHRPHLLPTPPRTNRPLPASTPPHPSSMAPSPSTAAAALHRRRRRPDSDRARGHETDHGACGSACGRHSHRQPAQVCRTPQLVDAAPIANQIVCSMPSPSAGHCRRRLYCSKVRLLELPSPISSFASPPPPPPPPMRMRLRIDPHQATISLPP